MTGAAGARGLPAEALGAKAGRTSAQQIQVAATAFFALFSVVGLALYGARGHGAGGGPTEVDDGTLVGRTGRRLRDWFAELF